MAAPRLTEAIIARAIRAARREGCDVVELRGHAIRILVSPQDNPLPSAEFSERDDGAESDWDQAFAGKAGGSA